MTTEERPILLCYDGSENAKEAVRHAAAVFPGRGAVVLFVWQPASSALLNRLIARHDDLHETTARVDAANADAAEQIADEGARLAREHGFRSVETKIERCEGGAWMAIAHAAQSADVTDVVIGLIGHSQDRAGAPGSVALSVVNRCRRPVLVVPPREAAHT